MAEVAIPEIFLEVLAQCETEQRKIALCPISDYRCYHQFSEKLSPVAHHAVRVRFLYNGHTRRTASFHLSLIHISEPTRP